MDHESEVKHFACRFLPKINVSGQTDTERCQLLCSTKFGHVLAAFKNDISVYKKADVHKVYDNEEAPATVPAPQPVSIMSFESRVTYIVISCDNLILAIVTEDNKISLVDVRSLNNNPAVFAQGILSAKCCGLMWNPGLATVLASATVTGEVTVWEVRGESLVQTSTKPTFGASCLCWSSKGKQLAVGTNDGKIFNLKPTLDEARCTQNPALFNVTALVRDIFWISTFEYVAVYECNDAIKVVHVQNQKDKNIATKYTDFDDIFYSEPGRAVSVLFCQILPWSTLVLGCSRGIELGVIGAVPDKQGQFLFNLDEGVRAEMPYKDGEPSYPVGMCVDYNHNQTTAVGEKSIQPCPVLITLTSEGVLCSFKLLNSNAAECLVKPCEQSPALPPPRSRSLVNLKKQAPFGNPAKVETPKPSLFGTPTASAFPKPASSGTSGLFSSPLVSNKPPLSFGQNLASSQIPAPSFNNLGTTMTTDRKATAPLSSTLVPSFTVPQSQAMQNSKEVQIVKEPLCRKPSIPVASKPLEKPVTVESKKKDSLENQANLDSIFAKSIDDEVKSFSQQLEQHKASSNRLEDVKDILNKDDLKEIGNKIKGLEQRLTKIHGIISNVNKDVSCEKDTLLVALASLEEAKGYYNCYNDPSYIALLKSKPLDKMTRKLRDDLFAKFAQMQNLVDELNIQLDTEWENMHSNKKSTPTSRTIYKTLSQHRTISNEQERTIDILLKQLGNITLKPSGNSPPTSKVLTTKSLSPAKQKVLRGIFENHTPKCKVITSPAKLKISSYNVSYAKSLALAPMKEHPDYDDGGYEKENDNVNNKHNAKPESTKCGVPILKYSEQPKFDLDDPTKLLDSDEKMPSVVLKYMPSTPQVVPSAEEKVKGAQELVSKLMDFAQKEKESASPTDKTFTQQFVPVMRTKGPVAPGQAPNAVIQPVSAIKDGGLSGSTGLPAQGTGLFSLPPSGSPFSLGSGTPPTSSLFGMPKTQSTSPRDNTSQPSEPSGLFSFASKSQSVTKTPVVDAKSIIYAAQPTASSTGSLFAPVSTPPLNAAQIGTKTTPILVTPKTTTPPQSNVFGTLKPASEPPKSPGDNFPVFGVPASQFDESRASPSLLPEYNGSSEASSTTSLASSKTDVKVSSSTDSTGEVKAETKDKGNIFTLAASTPPKPSLFSSTADSPQSNLFAAAPSSTNIFAMANSPSSSGNIFTSSSTTGAIFGSGGSTVGFFAPVAAVGNKESSPSIGGSLVSSQEKSPSTPPQCTTKKDVAYTPQASAALFATDIKKDEKPASAKNLFGSDAKENEGAGEGGLFGLKISSDEGKSSSPPKNPFGIPEATTNSTSSDTAASYESKPGPFTSNLFAQKPATSGGMFSTAAPTANSGLLSSTTPSSVTTTTSDGGLFGSTTTSTTGGALFGNITASTVPSGGLFALPALSTPGGGELFGGNTTSSTGGVFSSTTNSTTPAGIFGNTTASTPSTTELFSNTTTPASTTGMFGTTASSGPFTTSPTDKPSPFAANQNTGVFGSSTSSTAGSTLFGSTTTQSSGVFGGVTSSGGGGGDVFVGATNTTTSGGFGASSGGPFGNSNTSTGGFGFGSNNNPQSGFGAAPAFGSGPAFGSTQAFGNTQGAFGSSGFGSGPTFGSQTTFGNQPSGGGSVFGSGSMFGGNTGAAGGGGSTFGSVAATGGAGGIFGGNNNVAPAGFGDMSNQNSGGFLGNPNANTSFTPNKPSSFSSWR